jgi:hypothetical protein
MIMSRALGKAIGRLLIGVLLFAQFAIAGYACPGPAGRPTMSASNETIGMPSRAASETSTPVTPAEMAPGCDQMDRDAANLCVEHCRFGQQSADTAPAPLVFAAIPTFLYPLPLEPARVPGSGRCLPAPDASLAAAPPPPHAILHCVFRI